MACLNFHYILLFEGLDIGGTSINKFHAIISCYKEWWNVYFSISVSTLVKIMGEFCIFTQNFGKKTVFFAKWVFFVKMGKWFCHVDKRILILRKIQFSSQNFPMIFSSVMLCKLRRSIMEYFGLGVVKK